MESETVNSVIIKPIDRDTVHRICSGQVVVSLAITVKELIENAIDAGALKIEVRLKEFGSELVEVADDGTGVPKENFQSLTLKHFTSKLKEFDDLESIGTLGFRGEALSSLCALSDLTVITRHATAEHGTKIQYDQNGHIVSEVPFARPCGTTVSLNNLFITLPVRRKEFTKNLKKEYNKMCQLLHAYCLVSTGIKITCSNQTSKGIKTTIMSTQGSSLVRDNIISIFGPKQISTLIDITAVSPEENILQEFSVTVTPGEKLPFEFEFFISSVIHGSGRSTADRQFYFINSRPFEPNKIMKLVNQIYKQFNVNQYPFVYLNIFTAKQNIDVNVTPDKRQVFLEREKLLLATIKSSLLDAFKNFPSVYKMENASLNNSSLINQSTKTLKRSISETTTSTTNKIDLFESFKKKSKTDSAIAETSSTETKLKSKIVKDITKAIARNCDNHPSMNIKNALKKVVEIQLNENLNKAVDSVTVACNLRKQKTEKLSNCNELSEASVTSKTETPIKINVLLKSKSSLNNLSRKSVNVNITVDNIKNLISKSSLIKSEDIFVKFRSQISPDANKQAEEELQKQISKGDFKRMDVVGQFNLGFIIVKLENDLFIIDQHATDEKYNFEQLQNTTILESQNLVSPKVLELTAANEDLLIENEDIFKKNGFNFSIDSTAEATRKIKLTTIPLSKNVIFGKDDIDELLFMLQDSNHTMCRPSRVQKMFASRACRKSVMIGDALSRSTMKKIVDHMADIEQPWNCPHGRPTMRHLINLDLIHKR